MQQTLTWTLSQLLHRKSDFPYRVLITSPDYPKPLLDLRAKGRWPEEGRNIYCIRPKAGDDQYAELERVPVLSIEKKGGKLSVILDRPEKNECEFLATFKPFKKKSGSKENIYWRTAEALTANRPRVNIPVRQQESQITIAVNKQEKYAWTFPEYTVTTTELPAGDYALMKDGQIKALIRRATLTGLIEHLNNMEALGKELSELRATCPDTALVVEANYSDFLNPNKQDLMETADCENLIAQLQPQHPTLPIVYTGNRKLAINWAHDYFHLIAVRLGMAEMHPLAKPADTAHEQPTAPQPPHATRIEDIPSPQPPRQEKPTVKTGDTKTQGALLARLPETFTAEQFGETFPNVPAGMVKKLLTDLKKQGLLAYKRGKTTLWSKTTKDL